MNYNNSKIYKIISNMGDEIYIGSTTQPLHKRFSKHKSDFKCWQNKKTNYTSSFQLFEKFGIENCKIILIEEFPCENKDQLRAKEQFYIDSMICVNKYNSFLTPQKKKEQDKEYYELNKEKILEKVKEYREKNKEKISELNKEYCEKNKEMILEYQKEYREKHQEKKKIQDKEYRENNKEKISEYQKEYRENNKEKLQEYQKEYYEIIKENFKCECGSEIRICEKSRHLKTKKHQKFVNLL